MIKIGKRHLSEVFYLIFKKELFKIIKNFFIIHRYPLKAMYEEFFTKGRYPKIIETKQGVKVKLYSFGDFSTFNLVFCRQDYLADSKINTVLDIGSNIGITTHFWLYNNPHAKIYCYEPSKKNLKRFFINTKKFKKNIRVKKCAVSNFKGYSKLYKSQNGVNDSIVEKVSKNFDKIKVVDINDILKKIFNKYKILDVLKIDTEGCEEVILKSINKKYLKKIRIINVEGKNYNPLIPKYFRYSFIGSASRFENKKIKI